MKTIGCTVVHYMTGSFAICDSEMLNDSNWKFFDERIIIY